MAETKDERLERIDENWTEETDDFQWLINTAYQARELKEIVDRQNTSYDNLQKENRQLRNALSEINGATINPREHQPSYYTLNHIARKALGVNPNG